MPVSHYISKGPIICSLKIKDHSCSNSQSVQDIVEIVCKSTLVVNVIVM